MSVAWVRFYAELNDFLPVESRMKELARHFDVSGSVKDLIESFGVPHTEVDLVLINSEPADFTCLVRDQDRVRVYPVFRVFGHLGGVTSAASAAAGASVRAGCAPGPAGRSAANGGFRRTLSK